MGAAALSKRPTSCMLLLAKPIKAPATEDEAGAKEYGESFTGQCLTAQNGVGFVLGSTVGGRYCGSGLQAWAKEYEKAFTVGLCVLLFTVEADSVMQQRQISMWRDRTFTSECSV